MKISVTQETYRGEKRVALVPASVSTLIKAGYEVSIEQGAGVAAGYADAEFEEHGARIEPSRQAAFDADIVLQVRTAGANPDGFAADQQLLRSGQTLIGMCDPLGAAESIRQVAGTGANLFALELIPRITRAQSMDVLSSMATVAGYRAVLLAATHLPKMCPLMMTAAGTLTPARAFIIGAGVAGLQAIATSRRLGAVVQGYDVRPAVREQVESLGAKFVELELETGGAEDQGGYAKALGDEFYQKQRELMAMIVAESDIVITTAAIPGKKSPLLVTADAVRRMQPGSVIVDLAAERGGNCQLSRPDEVVVEHGVTILGPTNLPAEVPFHASQMYAKNITTFLLNMTDDGQLDINLDDEIVRGTLVSREGDVVNDRIRELLNMPARPEPADDPPDAAAGNEDGPAKGEKT